VRDEQGRQRELAQQRLELEPNGGARVRVQGCERLVEQQDGRVARERAREADALALAPRELAGADAGQVVDPEAFEELVHARVATVGDVPAHAQVREERVVLEHVADRAFLGRPVDPPRGIEPGLIPEPDRAGVGPRETCDRAQDGRLARAGRPDERDRLGPDLEREL
jgi:hypothetical protein